MRTLILLATLFFGVNLQAVMVRFNDIDAKPTVIKLDQSRAFTPSEIAKYTTCKLGACTYTMYISSKDKETVFITAPDWLYQIDGNGQMENFPEDGLTILSLKSKKIQFKCPRLNCGSITVQALK